MMEQHLKGFMLFIIKCKRAKSEINQVSRLDSYDFFPLFYLFFCGAKTLVTTSDMEIPMEECFV